MKLLSEIRLDDSLDPATGLIARDRELRKLLDLFGRGERYGFLFGDPNTGKTTLARSFATSATPLFPGGITFVHATQLKSATFATGSRGRSLLIIDDAHHLSEATLMELSTRVNGSARRALLLISREGHHPRFRPDFLVEVSGEWLRQTAFAAWSRLPRPSSLAFEDLRQHFNDRFFPVMKAIDALDAGYEWPEIVQGLRNFRYAGVLGPDGAPVSSRNLRESRLVVDVASVNALLLRQLETEPAGWYALSPRRFEEIVAEILSLKGYDVSLTPATADGGFDIYAAKKDGLGEFLFLIECKRYTPPRKVGVQVVRQLRGVMDEFRAVGAAVVTTSYFTEPALEYQSRFEHELKLHDYVGLQRWLKELRRR